MQIFRHLRRPAGPPLALAIGKFDGLHLGHQALLKGLVEAAAARLRNRGPATRRLACPPVPESPPLAAPAPLDDVPPGRPEPVEP